MATGFLHPGAMGASLAAACADERLWVAPGRSAATQARADAAGMVAVDSLSELARRCDVVVSICPPDAAGAVAAEVAATGYAGIYVDANAVAPETARRIGRQLTRFVDGGVIGPPAHRPGTTRLYLSGPEAGTVAARWSGSIVDARTIGPTPGTASALKACYAGWTKGSAALLLAMMALADAEGVGAELAAEWALSQPGLAQRAASAGAATVPKAWRFAGELDEIGDALAAHGLPDGFGRAAADLYRRLGTYRDRADVAMDDVIAALLSTSAAAVVTESGLDSDAPAEAAKKARPAARLVTRGRRRTA